MNLDSVRRVADAVLYEGYVLYPYRASAQKNRSRWQFGVVMPPAYARADPSERDFMRTECVLEHAGQPAVEVSVRFLQVRRRIVDPALRDVAVLPEISVPSWDEAVEQEVRVKVTAEDLLGAGDLFRRATDFDIPGAEDTEPVRDAGGALAGHVIRRREPLAGTVHVDAVPVPGPWQALRLEVRVENRSAPPAEPRDRDAALPWAFVAAHTILAASGGQFISMTDPPEWAKSEVEACRNVGCWPVLAGHDGARDVVLSSPIILYDHPRLAPESPGELYDGTEIDEILTLRTLALSDAEKQEARTTDPRAAALIDRVEALGPTDYEHMHGTIRREPSVPWWDPAADTSVSPDTDTVTIGGRRIARGSRVTLRPGVRRADAQDMFLAGRAAVVEAVLLDVDDNPYLAVSLADDSDRELRAAHGRFLYFAPDEVEP